MDDIYEVSKIEYSSLVETIKPEMREVKQYIMDNYKIIDIYSINTHKRLTRRKTYVGEDQKLQTEKYYIYNMPESYERTADIPKYHLQLDTREEVQAFLDIIAKANKKEK